MAADSRVWRDVRLTPIQELHERLMKDVLGRVRDLDLVLKGGSALAFTRGLNRHSTDLDFDAHRGVELSDRIEAGAQAVGVNLGPVERRDWSGHQRFLADYPNPFGGRAAVLKVNIHFRHAPWAENVEVLDGIRTYKVAALFDQELAAAASRIDPRDLFDLAFLMERYGTVLSDTQIRRADDFTEDLNRLERPYKNRFERDDVLRNLSSVDEVVLQFRYAITDQRTDPDYRNPDGCQGFRLPGRNASRNHVRERNVDWSISR